MKKSLSKALAVSCLLIGLTVSAQAAAILVTTPLTVAFNGSSSNLWDVDGNGTPEFTFAVSLNDASSGFDRIFSTPLGTVNIRKNAAATQMFNVGASFTNIGNVGTYSADANPNNIVNRSIGTGAVALSGTVTPSGFAFAFNTPGYLAFTFIGQSGSAQAAWAQITFSNAGVNGGFTINQWGYQTTALSAGGTLNVLEGTPVPEPSTYALAFGALALGVVAIRRRLRS